MDGALSVLYRALRAAAPGADAEPALAALRGALDAQRAAADPVAAAERLLACFHEALATAGPDGMALFDAMLLDTYPQLAALGALSDGAAARLLMLTSAAAASSAAPRDAVTAILEAMDQIMHGGGGGGDGGGGGGKQDGDEEGEEGGAARAGLAPAPAALLMGLVPLLPPLLRRLRRRKAAFAAECLGPAAGASRAAGGAVAPALDGAQGFAATEIGVFANFVRDVAQIIRSDESLAAGAAAAYKRQLARCALEMLAALTLGWRGAARAAAGGSGSVAPGALTGEVAEAVARLQGLLVDLGVDDLADAEQICSSADDSNGGGGGDDSAACSAGAALAALYTLVLHCGPAAPASAAEMLGLAARLGWRLAQEAQRRGNEAGLEQALALLWLGARRSAAAAESPTPAPEASLVTPADAAATAAELAPVVSLLAALMAQAPAASPLGKLARGAWAALFDAVRPAPLRAECLGRLLSEQHPEACELLLQRVRADAAAGALSEAACWRLAGPWLRPDGARGWRGGRCGSGGGEGEGGGPGLGGGGGLEVNANAVCAALNVLRLLLLRRRTRGDQPQQTAAGGGDGSSAASAAGSGAMASDESASAPARALPGNSELRASLLVPLQEAVRSALASAHAAAGDGGASDGDKGGGGGGDGKGKEGHRATVPGVAAGQGTPVDAWLALSRIDEVLGRVIELVE